MMTCRAPPLSRVPVSSAAVRSASANALCRALYRSLGSVFEFSYAKNEMENRNVFSRSFFLLLNQFRRMRPAAVTARRRQDTRYMYTFDYIVRQCFYTYCSRLTWIMNSYVDVVRIIFRIDFRIFAPDRHTVVSVRESVDTIYIKL